ncbi:ATP-binding cassette domain-containing protein [Rhodoblastus acidophilus]|jgi:cobalt/nickel transport system ATP-binding protein|uniref:ATP-binding cassette domain-containing protein n=1 Tax=Rhodoblastus acidophilus TaxID=1074 RepID=A0A6N8DK09_RHOAC|nr:ABC transporter ATP-binding protein [Rhodoblastus acidophilus]MCW2272938.1 cobalt/nickel transport system ATP-binding protein [Rhodoblastus acidophilus]MTV29845.1 ATP-binding cassette domain-containing protein [Rhodoblastus acidophilus]
MSLLFKLDSICVSRGGRLVLNEASMELAAGERLAIAGANGAGKTTLLRTLVGLEKPSAGRLNAFGQECRVEKDFRAVRARAGFLFQDPDDQLFSPTVIEDVAFGPLNLGLSQLDALRRAEDTLASLGLTPLSRRITHRLSGGEKRLVALASVMAMRPDILLLDEPTNALDEAHRARLIEILAALDVAMVIVSHDQDFLARLTTRALLLAEGRLGRTVLHRHVHTHDHLHIHGADDDHVHPHAKAT